MEPTLDWYKVQRVRAQQKRAELIKKRDRLNQRIAGLDSTLASLTPEAIAARKAFTAKIWEKE